jgi:hypothetical protein
MTASPRFEDRLLHELRHIVAESPAPAVVRSRRPLRTRMSLAAAGVAAATVAIVLVATGSDVTPGAYAVESRPDGAVSVSINSLRDAQGLQRSLRAAGVPAFVDYVAAGRRDCATLPPGAETRVAGGGEPAVRNQIDGKRGGGDIRRAKSVTSFRADRGGAATFTIDPGTLKAGEHVYITTSTGTVDSIGIGIGKSRPSPPCIPRPKP